MYACICTCAVKKLSCSSPWSNACVRGFNVSGGFCGFGGRMYRTQTSWHMENIGDRVDHLRSIFRSLLMWNILGILYGCNRGQPVVAQFMNMCSLHRKESQTWDRGQLTAHARGPTMLRIGMVRALNSPHPYNVYARIPYDKGSGIENCCCLIDVVYFVLQPFLW